MARSQGREPREGAELTSCGSDSSQQACSGTRCRRGGVPPPWSLGHTQGGLTLPVHWRSGDSTLGVFVSSYLFSSLSP